jgi:hypothetical protein
VNSQGEDAFLQPAEKALFIAACSRARFSNSFGISAAFLNRDCEGVARSVFFSSLLKL